MITTKGLMINKVLELLENINLENQPFKKQGLWIKMVILLENMA